FRKVSDRDSCRNAVQQLNRYLSDHPESKSPALSPTEQATLQEQYALDADEMLEVQNSGFTLLDADHLEFCLLLRDAMRSLKLEERAPLEKASGAFEWVMPQVGPQDVIGDAIRQAINEQTNVFPPHFVVRRGWGSALERSLVFMAALDQLGVDSCMVA